MKRYLELGYTFKFVWTGVGSREVPEEKKVLQEWVGEQLGLLGGVLSTGDAPGSDENFYIGYQRAVANKSRFYLPPAQIYYTSLKNQRNSTHNPIEGYHCLENYPETIGQAEAAAFRARGSFNGLFKSGIALHSRNAFQVLGEDMNQPRKFVIFYAEPKGKRGLVNGGTNTTVQIAKYENVKSINLFLEEDEARLREWIAKQFQFLNEEKA